MANCSTNEVMSPRSLEEYWCGALVVCGYWISNCACSVVTLSYFIHCVSTLIIKHCHPSCPHINLTATFIDLCFIVYICLSTSNIYGDFFWYIWGRKIVQEREGRPWTCDLSFHSTSILYEEIDMNSATFTNFLNISTWIYLRILFKISEFLKITQNFAFFDN